MAQLKQSFSPALPTFKRSRTPWLLAGGVVAAVVIAIIAYTLFSKPQAVPSALLFDRLFPPESDIGQLEKINIDLDGVLSHPVFRTLRPQAPLPLEIPPLGKPNPFI
jgi:hypothetical protein